MVCTIRSISATDFSILVRLDEVCISQPHVPQLSSIILTLSVLQLPIGTLDCPHYRLRLFRRWYLHCHPRRLELHRRLLRTVRSVGARRGDSCAEYSGSCVPPLCVSNVPQAGQRVGKHTSGFSEPTVRSDPFAMVLPWRTATVEKSLGKRAF